MSHHDPFAAQMAEQGATLRAQMAHRTALPEDAASEHPSSSPLSEVDAADREAAHAAEREAAVRQMQAMSRQFQELMARFNINPDEFEPPAAAQTASASAEASPPGLVQDSPAAPVPEPAPVPVLTEDRKSVV